METETVCRVVSRATSEYVITQLDGGNIINIDSVHSYNTGGEITQFLR